MKSAAVAVLAAVLAFAAPEAAVPAGKPDGAYYLCAVFDEANRVILITYQKNQISGLENPQ